MSQGLNQLLICFIPFCTHKEDYAYVDDLRLIPSEDVHFNIACILQAWIIRRSPEKRFAICTVGWTNSSSMAWGKIVLSLLFLYVNNSRLIQRMNTYSQLNNSLHNQIKVYMKALLFIIQVFISTGIMLWICVTSNKCVCQVKQFNCGIKLFRLYDYIRG